MKISINEAWEAVKKEFPQYFGKKYMTLEFKVGRFPNHEEDSFGWRLYIADISNVEGSSFHAVFALTKLAITKKEIEDKDKEEKEVPEVEIEHKA